MLECIDPHWRATCWLQVAVQGIAKEEVPWYELVTPLTSGVEGEALSLAKHLLMAWWWNIKLRREDNCPPTPTILNIGQFMTDEETAGGVGEPHWFMAYSHALQRVEMGMAHEGGSGNQSLPTHACLLAQNWRGPHSGQHKTLLGAHSQGPILPEGKQPHHPHHHIPG